MMYRVGGKRPILRRVADRNKETELATLRAIFIETFSPVPLNVAIDYVRSVSYKMRQYTNIDYNVVYDNDDD